MNNNDKIKKRSLVSRLEDAITRHFYGPSAAKARTLSYQISLQSPLWLWTHHTFEGDHSYANCHRKEMQKVRNLVEWFARNRVEMTKILILAPLELKVAIKRELVTAIKGRPGGEASSLPVVLAHHELSAINFRDQVMHIFQAVLYVFGLPPVAGLLSKAMSQEDSIGDAIDASQNAFVLLMDAGWRASFFTAKWTQWKNFLAKLQEEQLSISVFGDTDPSDEKNSSSRLPALVGSGIPLCCAHHPNQRQVECGLTPIVATCKRLCLHQHECSRPGHVCRELCHPAVRHSTCPFACQAVMACGHVCLQSCSEPCNCFQVIERPMGCSHSIVLGLDTETLEPIYGTVHHVFRGICVNAERPCEVEYTTECSRCIGPMQVKCFEAQQQQHSLHHRTLVCGACRRIERELRAQLLGTVLLDTEETKRRVKVEMQRTLHQQRKAAAQGLFRPGAKVEIVDPTKCVPPLFAEDDFPGIAFVDTSDPSFLSKLEGAYGTFVSNHVDVIDQGELRNLVRLPDGLHVLVTDGGLRMIRALTTSVKPPTMLLLTNGNAPSADSNSVTGGSDESADFAVARAMVNELFYLSQPVPCQDMGPSGILSDKVVQVVGVDPSSPAHVMAQCSIAKIVTNSVSPLAQDEENASAGSSINQADGNEPPLKTPRINNEQAHTPHLQPSADVFFEGSNCRLEEVVLNVRLPISNLDSLKGYQRGRYVFVMNPERQVTSPRKMKMLEAAIRCTPSLEMPHTVVHGARISVDTPYELQGIVNPPLHLTELNIGPCALLRPRRDQVVVTPTPQCRRRPIRLCKAKVARPSPSQTPTAGASPVVAIPFMFTLPDELSEAENALDTEAMRLFELRLQKTLAQKCEEISLRHDEEAFHAQQQMPEVSQEALTAYRQAFSIPVALPTPERVAEAKRRYTKLPRASPVNTRIVQAKDTVACNLEKEQVPQWVAATLSRFEKDATADNMYIRKVQLHQKQH